MWLDYLIDHDTLTYFENPLNQFTAIMEKAKIFFLNKKILQI